MSRPSPCVIRGGERGATLITALLLLMFLTILGVSALNSARVDTRIVTNTLGPQTVRHSAEEGLEWGRELLRQQEGGWNALLQLRDAGAEWADLANLPPGLFRPRPGNAPIAVQVLLQDDDDLDQDPLLDTNGVVVVRSIARRGNPADRDYAVAGLETAFRSPSFTTFYAQQGSDAGNTGSSR